jgi:hypothetical protein
VNAERGGLLCVAVVQGALIDSSEVGRSYTPHNAVHKRKDLGRWSEKAQPPRGSDWVTPIVLVRYSVSLK